MGELKLKIPISSKDSEISPRCSVWKKICTISVIQYKNSLKCEHGKQRNQISSKDYKISLKSLRIL